MRVAALTRYGRRGASSRLRFLQYLPALAAEGITTEVLPFFDDGYLQALYAGKATRMDVAAAFGRRLSRLLRGVNADLLWIEKEVLPWVPWFMERSLLPRGVPVVTDYDDAVFHQYDLNSSAAVRGLLGQKIDRVMAASALVVAGNAYLAARARAAGAARVEIVPTVVDTARYSGAAPATRGEVLRIGWIGTPSTFREYVSPMMPMLEDVAASSGARIRLVGAGPSSPRTERVEVLPWSEADEAAHIRSLDIGIMPLTDSPWSRGKCGYKLIQYMASGLPVVASPVGVNAEIVAHDVTGFLATTEDEWRRALHGLLADAGLRAAMGAAGQARAMQDYSLNVWAPRLGRLLHEAGGLRRGRA